MDNETVALPVKDTDLLSVAWIGASSPKGGFLLVMTVHGVPCIKLAGTVGTSETHSCYLGQLVT
jgi:hypothetical protein